MEQTPYEKLSFEEKKLLAIPRIIDLDRMINSGKCENPILCKQEIESMLNKFHLLNVDEAKGEWKALLEKRKAEHLEIAERDESIRAEYTKALESMTEEEALFTIFGPAYKLGL